MKRESSKLKFFAVCILLLAVFVSVPVSATDITELLADESHVDSYHPGMVDDVSEYVETISNELDLNLSPEEIEQYAVTLASKYLPATGKISPTSSIKVNNYLEFQQNVIQTLGLNIIKRNEYLQLTSVSESFCDTDKVMKIINQSLPPVRDGDAADPSMQSAPYAYGKTAYIPIFINFAGDVRGIWSYDDRETALENIELGIEVIQDRAPASADMEYIIDDYTISVSGVDDGKSEATWGEDGWMEEAAENLGFTSTSSSNQRSTEIMARYFENYYEADSVIFIYCIHDVGTSYALLPRRGYADSCVLYFWRSQFLLFKELNEGNVYAHESLHLYGALDEYPTTQSTDGITSYMAVNPLNEWYTNTNHHNNPNHYHSIMCADGIYGVTNPVISQPTRNFIGWGDKDNDGIIDAIEIRAGTT